MALLYTHLPATQAAAHGTRFSLIQASHHQEAVLDHPHQTRTSNKANRLAESLANLLHLDIDTPQRTNIHPANWNMITEENHSTPTTSPKDIISEKWREIHGSNDWEGLLDPLHPWLRREIVKYGEFAQATYDAFDFDSFSEYCGSCRYNKSKLFDVLGLDKNGYNVSKYIYAMSHIDMPQWLERSHLADTWSKHSNWMGVGNIAFKEELHQMGVKTLRIVVKQDMVPKIPGLVLNESLQKFDDFTGTLDWVYTHVGAELKLEIGSSPYLKRGGFNLTGFHSLETYLHLVDGFLSTETTFRTNARRDITLVNKGCDMLVDDLRILQCWYQLPHKGLVRNAHGRWVKPKRDPEDIPSPRIEAQAQAHAL
ncbi:hypothetical protein DVH24_011247 [Malus domestica]|uniref:Uncharacterized protein n=1 Tax=Malus domestica TaxID=3750 RepID=A0A498JZL1_MALDO|nr:hypothetical protein DVH24_011247 [Malus domestica]